MADCKKILFLTNSDFGQANVVLAVAHALLVHHAPKIEIHIASFGGIRDAVAKTSEFALQIAPAGTAPIVFHELDGITWGPAAWRPEVGYAEANDQTPNLLNSAKCVLLLPAIMLPWRPDEFLLIYRQLEHVVSTVNPDLTVCDALFTPSTTLCHHLSTNWVVLAPNTIKDFALPSQPWLAMMWKYPLTCSALPFPLPWTRVPRNILLCLVAAYALLTDTRVKNITQRIRQDIDQTISLITANELGVLRPPPPGLKILCSISPDLDYPVAVMPAHLVACGPVVRAMAGLGADDPLRGWLARGPTVYVNLGTHLKADPTQAAEMAEAFRHVLDKAAVVMGGERKLQILWKLGRKAGVGEKLGGDSFEGPWKTALDPLRSEVEEGRVRITDWVEAEPKSILESGGVTCSVNHGGANSFYEALCAGVPQVLLPPWSDCYDFGNRVEMLGIGRWANKQAKPRWEQLELANSINEVLFGPEAGQIKKRAVELAERHPEFSGRERAAEEIMALAS